MNDKCKCFDPHRRFEKVVSCSDCCFVGGYEICSCQAPGNNVDLDDMNLDYCDYGDSDYPPHWVTSVPPGCPLLKGEIHTDGFIVKLKE
jgi:hypothetical protein